MDYQCECGEEFDVYEQELRDSELRLNNFDDEVIRTRKGKCPHCGKTFTVREVYLLRTAETEIE